MSTSKKTAKILLPSKENLKLLASKLTEGHLVAIPTETVYGLAANAFLADSILNVFQTKERPHFDPLILHFPSSYLKSDNPLRSLEKNQIINLSDYSETLIKKINALLKHFCPGPLTILLHKGARVSDLITSGLKTVAIRFPSHPVAQSLLELVDFPLAAPSANRFNHISPTTTAHVLSELGTRIEYILEGDACEVGVESTVLYPSEKEMIILRPGKISQDEIEKFTEVKTFLHSTNSKTIQSPGALETHYAPRKPFFRSEVNLDSLSQKEFTNQIQKKLNHSKKIGLLLFQSDALLLKQKNETYEFDPIFVLSKNHSDIESAKNLFKYVRLLDESSANVLLTEPCPYSTGLGDAITDRLKKASKSL